MSFFRFIILVTVLQCCTYLTRAQDSNFVYQDTSVLYADSVETKEIEAPVRFEEGESEIEYFAADTILSNNGLSVNPDSVSALKKLKSFAYAKNLDSLLIEKQKSMEKKEAGSGNKESWLNLFFLSPITKYFFWILAGVFVSFILYKLFFTEGVFQRIAATTRVRALEDENEHLSPTTDYDKLIAGAVIKLKYRIAVRYHYLQLLQRLSSKSAIQFAPDKTNYQYVNELAGKVYQKKFAELTLHYEYVWYGEFEIDEIIFNSIQNKFKQFNKVI